MVFKLVRAGRTIGALRRAIDEDNDLASYVRNREIAGKRDPLREDVEMLHRYVEWLRFSKPASLYYEPPKKAEAAAGPLPARGVTSLPVASVAHVLSKPERWADRHVIIDGGQLTFFSMNRNGEHWHVLEDSTGKVVAVSPGRRFSGRGTLFGVARRTSLGKQLFLEIRDFHEVS